ncbi:general secretion pathway protein GspE [Gemmatimonadetes bacterium T265]|nr:general secretion pathway protein GspE [Gemmatimonadetes bacterium T265]
MPPAVASPDRRPTPPDAPELGLAPGLSRDYLRHHRVAPRRFADDGRLLIVAAAPDARWRDCVDDLCEAYGCAVAPEPAPASEVDVLIERLATAAARGVELTAGDGGDPVALGPRAGAFDDDGVTADARDLATQPPVVRYVNLLVRDAYAAGASDVHLEAGPGGLRARVRLDGVLVPAADPPPSIGRAVVSRVKLLAELDIAERRRPQDGRIRVRLEARELDLRVSTVPTVFGESVVLRLLDHGGRPVGLDALGMPNAIRTAVARLARRPHGLLLVTGPTGSGKTTTLYACLGLRDAGAEKLVTVEDPVEYQLPGVTQVPVHAAAGVTFAAALRAILRQDPDVVMVGEMRDAETADVAVRAALTGHFVFSTLHTNDAVGALPRLLDLGVAPYLVAATLDGVLAQRLVRCVCDACRTRYNPAPDVVAALIRAHARAGPVTDAAADQAVTGAEFTRGVGCASCRGTGYRGRVGLYELLPVNETLKDAVGTGTARDVVRTQAQAAGLLPLAADGWAKIREGVTTVEEVARVVQG